MRKSRFFEIHRNLVQNMPVGMMLTDFKFCEDEFIKGYTFLISKGWENVSYFLGDYFAYTNDVLLKEFEHIDYDNITQGVLCEEFKTDFLEKAPVNEITEALIKNFINDFGNM